jgi:hypothetical protein
MYQIWLIGALSFVGQVLFNTQSSAASRDAPPATFSAAEIRAGIAESMARIRSFRVVYESHDYDTEKYPSGTYLHRIVAAKTPYSLYHVSGHGYTGFDWQDDFYQQRAYVTKDSLFNEFPVNRHYFKQKLKPGDPLPGSLPKEFYFLATGIWPLNARKPPRPDNRPYMLTEVAISDKFSIVHPTQQLVNGVWCHVLEWPGYDTLWLDVNRGCALLARETHSRENGALVQRIELSNHLEVASGIWLPTKLRNIQYDWACPIESARKRVVVDAMHTVLEMSVNSVSDELFQFKPQPGLLLDDGNGLPKQAEPDGLDHLDAIVSWVRRNSIVATADNNSIARRVFWLCAPSLIVIVVLEFVRATHARLRYRNTSVPGRIERTTQVMAVPDDTTQRISLVQS